MVLASVGWGAMAVMRPASTSPSISGAGPMLVQAVPLRGIDVDRSVRSARASKIKGEVPTTLRRPSERFPDDAIRTLDHRRRADKTMVSPRKQERSRMAQRL